jgi:hypothetical protein
MMLSKEKFIGSSNGALVAAKLIGLEKAAQKTYHKGYKQTIPSNARKM